jgi:putative transposase
VPKTATLVRDVDEWYVCIPCKVKRAAPVQRTEPVVALDRGITILVADSDGNQIENPKHIDKLQPRIAHGQRVMARRQKGSKNYKKAKLKVAKLRQKERRQRDHSLHTISSRYSKSHAVVVLEDLRIENMPRRRAQYADTLMRRLAAALCSSVPHVVIRITPTITRQRF